VPALKAGAKRVAPAGKWIAVKGLVFGFKYFTDLYFIYEF
jgi:hypothetical protein